MLAGVSAGLQANHSVGEVGIEPTIFAMSPRHSSAELLTQKIDEQGMRFGEQQPPLEGDSACGSEYESELITNSLRLVRKNGEQGLLLGVTFQVVTQ